MNVTNLKQEIIKKVPEGYKVKTNFSDCNFLVSIGQLIIIAKPICTEKEVKYEFMLDTEFMSSNEINYDELVMIKDVIDILNENKKIAISKLKKWTVEEYENDRIEKEKISNEMFEALKKVFMNRESI